MKKNKLIAISVLVFSLSSCQLFNKYSSYEKASSYTIFPAISNVSNAYGVALAENVSNLSVDWVKGSVKIISSNDYHTITFYEQITGSNKEKFIGRFLRDKDSVSVRYCESGISMPSRLSKDLTIYIPSDLELDTLTVNNVSSSIDVKGINVDFLTIHNVSGNTDISDSRINSLSMENVSGNIIATLTQQISAISIQQTSGNSIINLPDNFLGYSVNTFETISGKFTSDFDNQLKYGEISYLSISFESVSGSLSIVNYKGNENPVDKTSENEDSGALPVIEDSGSWGDLL